MKINTETLMDIFKIEKPAAETMLSIIKDKISDDDLMNYDRVRQCYHYDRGYARLLALDELAETYGVELLGTPDNPYADYLNTGDAYKATLVHFAGSGRWKITSWGDIAESPSYQQRYPE